MNFFSLGGQKTHLAELIQVLEVIRHIPAVLEAGIARMGIQQLFSMFGAGEFSTLAAVIQLVGVVAADPQFAAPFGSAFLGSILHSSEGQPRQVLP